MSSTVDQIKERLNIVDVVSSYVKLERAGRYFKARSPFTNERTPSFFVSPDRGLYHCFSSGKGGDMFTFVQEMEGVDFRGALALLADRAGVTLTSYSGDRHSKEEKERLIALLEDATVFFQHNLIKNTKALSYLYKRGIKKETLKEFRIGFAPEGWDLVLIHLINKGYAESEIEKAGLIKKREGGSGVYDRFRSRIMFPITDPAGRVVAFSGRIFPHTDDAPKYVNSPETPLFHKSHILYGYSQAKNAIREQEKAMMVEGQMDVVLSYQAGIAYAVAASGTAPSIYQLKTLHRLAPTIIFAFDDDEAGLHAGLRAASLALSLGFDVRAAEVEPGKDPADMALANSEEWKKRVEHAPHVIDFYLSVLARLYPEKRERGLAINTQVLPLIKVMGNKMDQAHFIKQVASSLNITEQAVYEELEKAQPTESTQEQSEQERGEFRKTRTPVSKRRKDILLEQLASVLLWQGEKSKPDIDVNQLERELKNLIGAKEYEVLSSNAPPDEEKQERIFQTELYFSNSDSPKEDMEEIFNLLKKEIIREEFEKTMYALKQAEEFKDEEKTKTLLNKCRELSKQIATI